MTKISEHLQGINNALIDNGDGTFSLRTSGGGGGGGDAAGTVIATVSVDFTATGTTTLFTPSGTDEWAFESIIIKPTTVTAAGGDGAYNVGVTAALYADYINGNTLATMTTSQYVLATEQSFGSAVARVTNAAPLILNVTTGDGGTAFTADVSVIAWQIT